MDKNLYKFGMDWLNGVLPVYDVEELFNTLAFFSSKLRFERWELVNSGKYNYSRRYCLDGKASIQLMYNPVSDVEAFTACVKDESPEASYIRTHNNPYVFFSISGDGIRYLHSLGGEQSALNKLLHYFYRNGFKASRFDVYCDILDSSNEVVPLIQKAFKYFRFPQVGKITLRTSVQRLDKNCDVRRHHDSNGKVYYNCTLGNHGTRFGMFRCYNKLEEVINGRLGEFSDVILKDYGVNDYWYRLEYELHKENACACFNACLSNAETENSVLSFESIFASALERVFSIALYERYTQTNNGYGSVDVWDNFCTSVSSNTEYLAEFRAVPYAPMSKKRLHKYLQKNSVFVYSMLVALLLDRSLMESVISDGSSKYSSKKKYNEIRDELDVPPWMSQFVHCQLNRTIKAMDAWIA